MLDPLKTAAAALGTAFAAGAALVTIKHQVGRVNGRVDQVIKDLNGLGQHRVKKVDEETKELRALLDRHEREFANYRERVLRREMHFLQRLARMEERAGIPAVADFDPTDL